MNKRGKGNKMRVLAFQEENAWIGVVLEHYIVAQGNTLDELKRNLFATIMGELEIRNGDLSEIRPSPDHFQTKWNKNHTLEASEETEEGVTLCLRNIAA